MEEAWLIEPNDTENEYENANPQESVVGEMETVEIFRSLREIMEREKERELLTWEIVAERLCAFTGQVYFFSSFLTFWAI